MLTGAIEDQDLIDGLGLVFLLSGAALVAITYVLFQQATEYTKPHLPSISHSRHSAAQAASAAMVSASAGSRPVSADTGPAAAGTGSATAARTGRAPVRIFRTSAGAQRQFVANASHELRAPLTRQRALIEVALASPKANVASLRNAHERVLASEQHLEQLIDSLLALTRGQAGLERRERSDLAVLATRALESQRPKVERLSLDVDATLDSAPTAGDPRLLERVIANLIDNAIRHNTHGGLVEITTGTRDRHAFVSIENTGPTVPPEQIQRLFQPFQRLVDARTQHNNGHGLGLSIVKTIANAHRAELTARARPGGGLTIELSFPPATGAGSRMTLAARTKRGSPHAGVPPA